MFNHIEKFLSITKMITIKNPITKNIGIKQSIIDKLKKRRKKGYFFGRPIIVM